MNQATEDMQALRPYQHRVVQEQGELKEKITALEKFLHGSVFKKLPLIEQQILAEQFYYMNRYATCLRERVERF